ncbi:NAD-dependent deacetylase sirtuin-2 [Chlorella sorokiniana]|uniref:NAD-dependent deacetylase sirtuin-2 n=1 Tax=Chlorella sorokiniana TaxID=3076 RepID=A0A2P6TDX3_CHLSO|nr:NAD-dependent deacetylase sirtuin-2 [Chlorella sorokiniana]|eukprot:PRW20829.1 NAD-dependent deacetylase sirtuin-2 [Chlorella sorokiniana]
MPQPAPSAAPEVAASAAASAVQEAVPTAAADDDDDAVEAATEAAAPAAEQPRAASATSSDRSAAGGQGSAQPPSSSSDVEDEGAEPSGRGYSSSSEDEEADLAAVISRLKEVLSVSEEAEVQLAKPPLLPTFDLAGIAALIKAGAAKRIICMCGAGISVSAGIPDFRSPGTGLYHRLEEYGLPHPHAVFEIDFFRRNPRPFYTLAKELFPGTFLATPTHYFMRLLHDKGLLLRCFTQNIDSLEHQAGLPTEAVVAAHGNFDTARCIKCGMPHDVDYVREAVFKQEGNPCHCKKRSCNGLVKPDIVFFGESLPERFWERVPLDFSQADLLIVMGTSLVVNPFAGLIDYVGQHVPRVLINREKAGELTSVKRSLGYTRGFDWDPATNYRDALYLGDCDAGVRQLCQLLGWEEDLDALMAAGQAQFEQARAGGAAGAVEDAAVAAAGSSSTEAVLRATAEAAAGAAQAAEPAGEAAAEVKAETVAAKVAAQAAL